VTGGIACEPDRGGASPNGAAVGGASSVAGVDEASNAAESGGGTAPMIRWLGVVLLALLNFNAAGPWL